VGKHICNVRCWVGGKKKAMFEPGEIVDFAEDEIVPGHFTCIEPKEEVNIDYKPMIEEKTEKIEEMVEILKEEVNKKPLRKPNFSKE